MLSYPTKPCKECGEANNSRAIACINCGYGFSVGRNGGRPRNTTRESGSFVSDGRPRGTAREPGNNVSGGRARNTRQCPEFDNTIQLPADRCHSNELVNIDNDLLDVCT